MDRLKVAKTIAVGMSGGVDSTITAYLLKKKGFNVIGITMTKWDENLIKGIDAKSLGSGCFSLAQEQNMSVVKDICKKIDIPHNVVNLRKEYQKFVLDYFTNTYTKGQTPNPCVMCNRNIKFGLLLDRALQSGIDFDLFATGHYANIAYDESSKNYVLKKAKDKTKDQTYFLWNLVLSLAFFKT